MSLFNTEDEPQIKVELPVLHRPNYQSHVVDTEYTPRASLITSISGYPMMVDYYNGIVSSDDPLDPLDGARSPVHQQFLRIRHFELKIETPMDPSQDESIKSFNASGTANVYPPLVPNRGDVFIADTGDGRAGIYTVNSVRRMSHFKEAVHQIEFALQSVNVEAYLFDLARKVVKTTHFRREYLDYGQNPFIEDEVIDDVRMLEQNYQELVTDYFERFWSNEYRTIVIPGQSEPYYDHFAVHAIREILASPSHPNYQRTTLLNVTEDDVFQGKTVFDLVLDRNLRDWDIVIRKMGLVSTTLFSREPRFNSIRYSGITQVMYPNEDVVRSDYQRTRTRKPVSGIALQNRYFRETDVDVLMKKRDLNGFGFEKPIPLLHPVHQDGYYIFSPAFYYRRSEDQSLLETQVLHYLSGQAPNPKVIRLLLETYASWGALERYYYTPFLLVLIFHALRMI